MPNNDIPSSNNGSEINPLAVQINLVKLLITSAPPEVEMRFGTTKEGLEEMLRRAPTNNDKAVIDFFTNQFELACFEENSAGDRFIRVICDYGQVSTKNGQPIPGLAEYTQRADKFDVYLYEDGTSRVTKSSY